MMIDYGKVVAWDIEGDEVILYDVKGKKVDTLSVESLVDNWLKEAKQRQKRKIFQMKEVL